jgi:hypothetical protein
MEDQRLKSGRIPAPRGSMIPHAKAVPSTGRHETVASWDSIGPPTLANGPARKKPAIDPPGKTAPKHRQIRRGLASAQTDGMTVVHLSVSLLCQNLVEIEQIQTKRGPGGVLDGIESG